MMDYRAELHSPKILKFILAPNINHAQPCCFLILNESFNTAKAKNKEELVLVSIH